MTLTNGLFYSCGCSPEARGGLYLCRETENGTIENVAFTPLAGTNYLCYSPDGKNLYATWNEGKTGGVAAYTLNPDGTIVYLNRAETDGAAACHLTTSPDGKFLYAVNYLDGNFAEFRLAAADGAIEERTQVISHKAYPVGPRPDRQECAHTHCTRFTPDGKRLCIVDLGVDRVFLYPYTPGQGLKNEPEIFVADPGDGPRHIIFTGNIAYIINELGNSITSCRYENETLTAIGKISTLPENCDAVTKASAIRICACGKYLYASNRGYDSIACYRIVEPGKLEIFDIVDAHGDSPRDINFLPSGRYFTASNEFSDRICFYGFDPATGKLTYLEGQDVTDQPRPLCIEY